MRKPKGWTSFDVVKKIRGILGVKKVGHAGTLDPLATGLLIVGTGSMTKELSRYQELEKEYKVEMRLGGRTESLDSETPVLFQSPIDGVTEERLKSIASDFVGEQMQVPPMYSAVKVRGKALYKYARKGEEVERSPRQVFIRSIAVRWFRPPDVELNVICSKGTYVRTLVDDIGLRLGCGAFVTGLERVRIGEYLLEDACSLDDLKKLMMLKA